MRILTVGSGSTGNCYVIDAGEEYLMLECGLPPTFMLDQIGYGVDKIQACLVSHTHTDHAAYLKRYTVYGFPIYMSEEASGKAKDLGVKQIKRRKKYKAGGFTFASFGVPHDGTECDGFLIEHAAFGKLLFLTDLEYCPINLSKIGINHLMVECNYDRKWLTDAPNIDHICKGHMEIETALRLAHTLGDSLEDIGLIHLSAMNGNGDEFKGRFQDEFPNCNIWIAQKGTIYAETEKESIQKNTDN